MKMESFAARICAVVMGLLAVQSAWATDYVWNTDVKNGDWANAANWLVGGAATEAYPSSSSDTATFPAGGSATISLTAGYALGGMTVDTSESANWRFVGTGDYSLNVTPQITGDGTGSVVFKRITTGMNGSTKRSGALTIASEPKSLTFDQNCGWSFSTAQNLPNTRITLLRHGALKGGWKASTFGDLAVYGENYAYGDMTMEFGSFIDMGGVACVEVNSGKLKFRNTSGITLIGGTQTLTDAGSQIPVAPQFAVANAATDYASLGWNTALPLGACTLDADGVVRQIPTSTMKSSFDDAGELDNVYIGAATTLTKDTTVNAVVYGANIDLGGFTLTIKSGVLRPTARGGMWTISNGKVVTCAPMLLTDGVNNTDSRLTCDFATSGNNDPMKAMFNYVPMAGSVPQAATFADFIGAIIYQHGNTPLYSAGLAAANVFREISDTKSMSFDNHWMVVKGAGVGGNGSISATSKFNPQIVLGDIGDTTAANYNFYIGSGAVLAPGSISEDGYRRGTLSCCYRTGNLNGFENITFFSGSKFQVVLRADGTATKLECQYGNYDKKYSQVTLAGALEITEANRCPGEATWTILSVGREIAGAFDSVTEGYTVQYNVDLGTDANGMQLYGVTVTKNAVPAADNSVDFTEDEPTYDFTAKSLTIGGTATKIGDEADYVKATIEYGDTAELGSTIELATALGKDEKYTQKFEGPFAGAQKFYYRVTLTSNLKFSKTSAVHEFIAPVEIVVADPVYDQAAGTITVSATADAAVTATLFYGDTAELGKSEELGAFAAGAAMAKTFSGYEPAEALYYKYSLVDANGTVTTTSVNQAIMPAGGELADVSASVVNTQVTIDSTVAARGLGTVTINYYIGTAANNLTLVGSHTLADGEQAEQSFSYTIGAVGSYYYAVEIVNEYKGETWTSRTTSENTIATSDASTYTWLGGTGVLTDKSKWTTSDIGGVGYPVANCSIVVPAGDSDITFPSHLTISNLTVSATGTHAFRSGLKNWNGYPTYCPITMTGVVSYGEAADGEALGGVVVLDGMQFPSNKQWPSPVDFSKFVFENSAAALVDSCETLEVAVLNGGMPYGGWATKTYGKLTAASGTSRVLHSSQAYSFATFADAGNLGAVIVRDGAFTLRDTAGVEMVGGSATLADATSQIPVATRFLQGSDRLNAGWGLCTVDADGVVRAIPTSTMKTSFDDATELDNVYIGAETTLEQDVVCNAVVFAASINLNGHSVTVKSGAFRPAASSADYNHVVSNGTIVVSSPSVMSFTVNNPTATITASVATEGNDDPWKPMLFNNSQNGAYIRNYSRDFVGLVVNSLEFKPDSYVVPNIVVDLGNGYKYYPQSGHNQKPNLAGIAGSGSVVPDKFHPTVTVGFRAEGMFTDNTYDYAVVVTNTGCIYPGRLDYDGGRRGSLSMSYNKERLDKVLFFDGGRLAITLRPNSEATCLDLTATAAAGSYIALTLGGELELTALGHLSATDEWTIVKTGKPMTGYFANAGEKGKGIPGYLVKYNVAQADGTYAVTVMKKSLGLSIYVR